MGKYAIGIDYGSLSARALVVDINTGEEVASSSLNYKHAVMDQTLPDGTKLPPDWALQHPQDYLDCLGYAVPKAMEEGGIDPRDIVGVGIDFTACTMLPVDKQGTPLCFLDQYKSRPHSYVKLWKHHAAQPYADRLNEIAKNRGESFLSYYGEKTSSEWMIPKIWQILEEDFDLYQDTSRFMEAGDWVIQQLTGEEKRGSCAAGYKALWHKKDGYPSNEFFKALDIRLENVVDEKLSRQVYPSGTKAGEITLKAAKLTGLNPGTPVAVANVDAHVSLPSSGKAQSGDMIMIMGTSTCHTVVYDKACIVPGMSGMVEDGIIPGLMGYESNQVMGDHFNWFVNNCVPESYTKKAREENKNLHTLLSEMAEKLAIGQSGLLALDWWNGNRSVLVDGQLSGLMIGLTLQTKAEEIYRTLVEATAFGARVIHEAFEDNGVEIKRLFACGGISHKNPFVMQIYADVLGKEISVVRSNEAPALGAAMFGSVAGGYYKDIVEAAEKMGGLLDVKYVPNLNNQKKYEPLYREFVRLHDYFGRGENQVMKRLKAIKAGNFDFTE